MDWLKLDQVAREGQHWSPGMQRQESALEATGEPARASRPVKNVPSIVEDHCVCTGDRDSSKGAGTEVRYQALMGERFSAAAHVY